MNVKLIVSQVVVLTALIALYVYGGPKTAIHVDGDEAEQRVLSSLPVDRLRAIELSGLVSGKRVTVKLVRPSGNEDWHVASSWDYPVKKDAVDQFLKRMREIKKGQVQTEDLQQLDKFELDKAQRSTIRFLGKEDKELASLVYGKLLPGGGEKDSQGQTYILHANRVRRAPHTLGQEYLDSKHWLDLEVVGIAQDDLVVMQASGLKFSVTVKKFPESELRQREGKAPKKLKKGQKEKSYWRQLEIDPVTRRYQIKKVNESMVESLVWSLINESTALDVMAPIETPEGQRDADPQQKALYGLDQPLLEVLLVTKDETQVRLVFGEVKKYDADGHEQHSVYVVLPNQQWIKKDQVSGSVFGKGNKTREVLVGKMPVYKVSPRLLKNLQREQKEFDPPKEKKKPKKAAKKDPKKQPKKDPKKDPKKQPDDETISVRMILIGYKGAMASKATRSMPEARGLLMKLHLQLIAPGQKASFADLARKHSEHESKKAGGDLGFISRRTRSKEFTAAAFKLKKGQISGPVPIPGGIVLIQRVE